MNPRLRTVRATPHGDVSDAATVGHLCIIGDGLEEAALELPSASVTQINAASLKDALPDIQKRFTGSIHVTVCKNKDSLTEIKNNITKMRQSLDGVAIDDHFVVWKGNVPSLPHKGTTNFAALSFAQSVTVLPQGLDPQHKQIEAVVIPRQSGCRAVYLPLEETNATWFWYYWIWVFVFVLVVCLIISFSCRRGKRAAPIQQANFSQQQRVADIFSSA